MSPIVLALRRLNAVDKVVVSFTVEQPFDVANDFDGIVIDDDPAAAPFATPVYEPPPGEAAIVQRIGEAVCKRMLEHPGVKQLFAAEVAQAPNSEAVPIYVRVDRSSTLPWETVYHPKRRFLALDPQGRGPMARLPRTHGPERPTRVEVPLRIAAVVSAANREGAGEWKAMLDALAGSAVEWRMLVLVAEDALQEQIAALADPRIEARCVPGTPDALVSALKAFRPQLLHFFCHGLLEQRPHLEIATRASHDGSTDEHVYLNADHLQVLARDLWLVVLNACRGADDGKGGRVESLAFELVAGGVPAAIGMRDVIDMNDAVRFTRAFYTEAVRHFGQQLAAPGERPFRWADVLAAPRSALCRKHGGVPEDAATKHAEWTLPILYVRHVEATIEACHEPEIPDAEREALTAELTLLRAALKGASPLLGQSAPPDVVAALAARAEQIEERLRG